MFKPVFAAIVFACSCSPLALAQGEARMETVVVTGSYIDSETGERPAVSLRLPADHVLFEMNLSTGSLEAAERRSELERTLQSVRRAADRRSDVQLFAGNVEVYAALETAELNEIIANRGERSTVALVVKITVNEGDDFLAVRRRANEFVEAIEEAGRTQSRFENEQYLSLDDPGQYRQELLGLIGEDLSLISGSFADMPILAAFDGLHRPIVVRPVGPLELELFIPYEMDIEVGDQDGD